MSADPQGERALREWPLDQLAEQAALHPMQGAVLAALLEELRHRPGTRAKALEARLRGMLAACTADVGANGEGPARLRATLALAAQEIAALRARLATLEAGYAGADDPVTGAHRRVHLTPDAPAWLVAEVRRAYRRRYHPDAVADQQRRPRAEEIFKRAEACFAAIERQRRV